MTVTDIVVLSAEDWEKLRAALIARDKREADEQQFCGTTHPEPQPQGTIQTPARRG